MRSVAEWISRSDDQRIPARVRLRVFQRDKGRCHISGRPIRPGDLWDLDHIIPLALGGQHRESNLAPALRDKHKEKTRADVAQKSSTYQRRLSHAGIKRKSGRSFPTNRDGRWKRKISGEVVRRD